MRLATTRRYSLKKGSIDKIFGCNSAFLSQRSLETTAALSAIPVRDSAVAIKFNEP
jgi:hypothetical protein